MKKWKQVILLILIGLVVSSLVVLPYFHTGYFPTHDGEWAVVRASEMYRELRDMQFPPRYSGALNFGYGYPLFNFAYPLPYYLTTIAVLLGFGIIASVKIIFVLSVFLSFLGMFLLSLYFWKNKFSGFLSAILYVYLPYRMVDLYVRGSIGESVAFSLYPLVFLAALLILNKKYKYWGVLLTSICMSFLFVTHNISAVYISIILATYVFALLVGGRRREAILTIFSIVWSVLLSSFFIFPALIEKQYVKLAKIPIADRALYYVSLPKLILPSWGYGTPTDTNSFTYQLGIPQIIGVIASIASIKKLSDIHRIIIYSLLILTGIFLFMMFSFSGFLWRLPLLSEINYPWTLLLPLGFLMSFLSGGVMCSRWWRSIFIILTLISIITVLPYAVPEKKIAYDDSYYLTNEATTTSSNELMPLWVRKEPSIRFENKIEAGSKIDNLTYTSKKIIFDTNASTTSIVKINQIFYPGWTARVNGKKANIEYNNKYGIMALNIAKGLSHVELSFSETPLRYLANCVSFISVIGAVLFLIVLIFRRGHEKQNKK